MAFFDVQSMSEYCNVIKAVYAVGNLKNKIADGDVAYPNAQFDSTLGMSLELQSVSFFRFVSDVFVCLTLTMVFRNVSFAYPGGNSKESALKDVSLKITPGQLVVIVGANGSGKSTVIKLLQRIYDVNSGEVIVDGLPINQYRISNLRSATATLTQDHHLFPLSIRENIGLGYPDCVEDEEMVLASAKDGGALGLIEKFSDGLDTTLEPVKTAYGHFLDDEKHKKLKEILGELEKSSSVSGRTGNFSLIATD